MWGSTETEITCRRKLYINGGGLMGAAYKLTNDQLTDSHNHKLGYIRGQDYYTGVNHKVGYFKGNDIFDSGHRKVAYVKGDDVFDSTHKKIARLSDLKREIDGANGGTSVAGFWWFFVR